MRVPLPIFIFLVAPLQSLSAQNGTEVHRWVKTAVDTSLDYHCRAKFGDTEQTITPNPDKLVEKWSRLGALLKEAERLRGPDTWKNKKSGVNVNRELLSYFHDLREWELWLRSSKQDLHRKMDFFLVRIALESVGGEGVENFYDRMPASLEANQDLPSVVSAGIEREMEIGQRQLNQEVQRLNLIETLSSFDEPNATATANELVRLARKAEYEQQWLKKYRPGLLTAGLVEDRKKLFAIKQSIASRMTPEKLEKIRACPGVLCRQFVADYSLAEQYEGQSMPGFALDPTESYSKLLDRAYKESLDWHARYQQGSGATSGTLMELLMTTNQVFRPRSSSGAEPFDYVNPIDIPTIAKQKQAVLASGEDYGFLGMIDAPEVVKAVRVVGDQTLVALGQTGLATYDLQSGKLEHLLYDLRPDIELWSIAVNADGAFAYVVTDEPKLLRYDLSTGKRDSNFSDPTVARKDAQIAVSPDGRSIALGVLGKIFLYDAKSGKAKGEFKTIPNLSVYGLQFASGGRSILIHGNGPLNYEFDVRSGDKKRERRIVADKSNSYCYDMTRANGMFAGAGVGAIAAWPENSAEPKFRARIPGSRGDVSVRWASVTPDKTHFICSHGIWNMTSGDSIVRFVPRWNAEAMALVGNGSRLIIAIDKTIFVVPSCLDPVRKSETDNKEADNKETKRLQPRTWTDKTGKYKILAVLIGVQSDKVTLRKSDGSHVQVPLSILSDTDRKYLSQHKR